MAGPYLDNYADELAFREDNRRESNGAQFKTVATRAAVGGKSRQWVGYWQRHRKVGADAA